MSETYSDFLPLRVVTVGTDGKRRYDKRDKQRLIEACLQPGVSVAGMALKAGVNANQLRRWIGKHKAKLKDACAMDVLAVAPAAFVPVMEVTDGNGSVASKQPATIPKALPAPVRRRDAMRTEQSPPLPSRLKAQLPNGVSLELECAEQNAALVRAMIEALRAR
jgi:transposase